MTTFVKGASLQNDNVRITKSGIRFGPLDIRRVAALPSVTEGRIGDIVIVDNSKGSTPTLPINRVPTNVGIFQKTPGGISGTWTPVGASPGVFVATTGDTMTGDLIIDNARIGINEPSPTVSLDIVGTDAIRIPQGTTIERPTGKEGLLRLNTDSNLFEGFVGTEWEQIVLSSDQRLGRRTCSHC
jgi:hypothetical protein